MNPEEIIGADAVLRLEFAGFKIVACEETGRFDRDFEDWWQIWPNRTAKITARKAYIAARQRSVSRDRVIEGTARYLNSRRQDQPWPHPATWLNRGSYDDVPAPVYDKRDSLGAYRDQLRQEIADEGFVGRQGADRGAERPLARLSHDRR